jgi:hypothetical protein
MNGDPPMLYALLCYNNEAEVFAWDQDQDAAVMARLEAVQQRLDQAGKLGPSLRLLPTTAATTLRKDQDLIIDGPYAETKEQLLGFYLLDIAGLEEGLEIARDLAAANPGGAYEIRPIGFFMPGKALG